MEHYDAEGVLRQRRQVNAELIVYQSAQDEKLIAEFRNVRAVDGKPIYDYQERAAGLFERIQRAKTLDSEMDKLRDEWLQYDIGRRFWGYTITQGRLFKALAGKVRCLVVGRERFAERETMVLAFQQFEPSLMHWGADPEAVLNDISGLRNYVGVKTHYRGRLWLDAETGQLWRQEVELTAQHASLDGPQVMLRWEQQYQPSEYGILTPQQFVFSWFSYLRKRESAAARLLLTSRTTYNYGKFTRFDVTTEEGKREIIKKEKP
jgi:hypothetical protein